MAGLERKKQSLDIPKNATAEAYSGLERYPTGFPVRYLNGGIVGVLSLYPWPCGYMLGSCVPYIYCQQCSKPNTITS